MKPILFNTPMVQAILDGRKTQTRRMIKPRYRDDEGGFQVCWNERDPSDIWVEKMDNDEGSFDPPRYVKPPYEVNDILYVRETWAPMYADDKTNKLVGYIYKADDGRMDTDEYDRRFPDGKEWPWPGKWRPSIHMPKDAARIFLRVTDVRPDRLQDITMNDMQKEGVIPENVTGSQWQQWQQWQRDYMKPVWDSTIKPKDRDVYGWDANPWVWVIAFEQIDREDAGK